jgi:hypothetical protein
MASLQPDGLCLIEAAVGKALREFMLASCNSPRGRPCDIPSLGNWVGGFKPEGFEKPYSAPVSPLLLPLEVVSHTSFSFTDSALM